MVMQMETPTAQRKSTTISGRRHANHCGHELAFPAKAVPVGALDLKGSTIGRNKFGEGTTMRECGSKKDLTARIGGRRFQQRHKWNAGITIAVTAT
jgi:hypothetical protein